MICVYRVTTIRGDSWVGPSANRMAAVKTACDVILCPVSAISFVLIEESFNAEV